MAAALSDQELAAIEAQLSANPAILRSLQEDQKRLAGRQRYVNSGAQWQQGRADVLRQYGIEFPDAGDYQIQVDPQGRVKLKRQSWFERNADWILPVATIGGGAAAGFSGGGGGAAGGGSASSGGSSAGGSLGGSAAGGSATGGGSVAGGSASTGGKFLGMGTRDWLTVASMGGTALSEWYRNRQADKAAGREVDMSREALALEKEMFEKELEYERQKDEEDKRRYEQDRADTLGRDTEDRRRYEQGYADMGPYRSIGLGALDRLAFGVGIPGKPSEQRSVTPPTATAPTAPTATPMQNMGIGTLQNLGTPQAANVSGGGMTTMRTPTGQTVLVPAAKVQEAIANGGTVLQGAA